MTEWTAWEKVEGYDEAEIIYEKKYRLQGGGVARILVNRPQRMNALTGVQFRAIAMAVREANVDPNIGVIVVGGNGDHFGVGGDIEWEASGGLRPENRGGGGGTNEAVRHSRKPVIAMVRGYCIGGSHHLAWHCDLTISSDNAIYGQNGPRVASPAHGEVVAMLAHVIGLKRAREVWMMCRRYTAQQALEWGLINCVVPDDRLEEEVDRWCDELLDISPDCLAIVKQSFEAVGGNLHMESDRILYAMFPDFHDRPDVKEAQTAFFERRRPNFWAGKLPKHLQPATAAGSQAE